MLPSRYIIEELEFSEQLTKLIPDPELADEFLEEAKALLTEIPEAGEQCGQAKVWMWPVALMHVEFIVKVYYTFDDSSVTLLHVLAH